MQIFAIVPAAGIGSRMKSAIPKQYLDLAGKPVLSQTLAKIAKIKGVTKIVVALHPDDIWFEGIELLSQVSITTVTGGKDRQDSVLNALKSLSKQANNDDWVLVHDAARPLVNVADIEKLMEVVKDSQVGGILASPVNDTLKQASANNVIEQTVDRSAMWRALTPQLFRFGLLYEALSSQEAQKQSVTDESQAIEFVGKKVLLVEGSADNIKITTAADLAYARWLMSQEIDSIT